MPSSNAKQLQLRTSMPVLLRLIKNSGSNGTGARWDKRKMKEPGLAVCQSVGGREDMRNKERRGGGTNKPLFISGPNGDTAEKVENTSGSTSRKQKPRDRCAQRVERARRRKISGFIEASRRPVVFILRPCKRETVKSRCARSDTFPAGRRTLFARRRTGGKRYSGGDDTNSQTS